MSDLKAWFCFCAVGLVTVTFLTACAMFRTDPVTGEQIARTIEFETSDYALTLTALEDGILDDKERLSLQTRHDSEVARLAAWLRAESAKVEK